MKSIITDRGPGDDDASAILWCLELGEVDIQALTITQGNVELEKCVVNGLRVLEAAGRADIPLYQGVAKPLVRPVRYAHWIHAQDGLGDAGIPYPKFDQPKGMTLPK
jgi:inosine-uridine nucleoside N-ribohydrolase